MNTEQRVADSLGFLEGWIEKVGAEFKVLTAEPLERLAFLEEVLKQYRKKEQSNV
jgi:hypothetical protein